MNRPLRIAGIVISGLLILHALLAPWQALRTVQRVSMIVGPDGMQDPWVREELSGGLTSRFLMAAVELTVGATLLFVCVRRFPPRKGPPPLENPAKERFDY